ncbi:MAG: DUF1553 domain-containing protein [Verrucomicrobia bacterium]|nr:DUF1553 domain-containing protein [Verrucomicrobiota bacterium]
MKPRRAELLSLPLLLAALPVHAALFGPKPAPVDFSRDIRPIMSDTCFKCHGFDDKARKGKLRLDLREEALKSGTSGKPAIVPGKPGKSEVVSRLFTKDADDLMPPSSMHKTISPAQKELFRRWVAEGAKYAGHWAFEPAVAPAVPRLDPRVISKEVISPKSGRPLITQSLITSAPNSIDAFLAARLEVAKLKFQPEAPREVLFRRVTLALTGLPPTLADTDAFLADKSPRAYETVVDRLLASPHFGERVAVPWLDLARHSDSAGYHNDSLRETWLWRDWVVRAFNDNKPFDKFTIEQLAGDLLPNATVDQKIASGFMRNVMTSDEGGIIDAEYLNIYLVDRVSTLGTTWFGMSIACAQCHDHKYDPVTMRDFYSLYAFFHNVPEKGKDGTRVLNPEPRMAVPSSEQDRELAKLTERIASADKRVKELEGKLDAAQLAWEAKVSTDPNSRSVAGPYDHFPLNTNAHGVTHDGKEIEATLSGETGFADGVEGNSLLLSGKGHADLGARYDFDKADKFSVGLWVRTSAKTTGAPLGKMENGPNFRGWDIEFAAGKASIHLIHKWPEEVIHVQTEKELAADTFQHLAFTYDGSGKAAGLKLFVNGQPVATKTLKDKLPGSIKTTAPFAIGRRGGGGSPFTGRVDELYVFPRALTEKEVATLAGGPTFALAVIEKTKRTKEQSDKLQKFFRETQATDFLAAKKAADDVRQAKTDLEKLVPTVMVMAEMAQPRDTFIKVRGAYDKNGDKVEAAFPAFLPKPATTSTNRLTRLDLAQWLASPQHPLTARVAVNRFWAMMFGTGLVKTVNDFGSQGEWPSHPELLNWLAADFARDWDVKRVLKQMVMSHAFRQSAVVTPALLAKDSENRLLARGPRGRLDAEFVRDNALAIAGLLNTKLGGKPVFPYQPPGIWEVNEMAGGGWKHQRDDNQYRRALYIYHRRSTPYPSLLTFDAPNREVCAAARARTSTPLQSLVLMNDPVYVEAARAFAARVLKEGGADDAAKLNYAWRLAVARNPSATERGIMEKTLGKQRELFAAEKPAAESLLKVGDFKNPDGTNATELAAWTAVANVILNLNETISQ